MYRKALVKSLTDFPSDYFSSLPLDVVIYSRTLMSPIVTSPIWAQCLTRQEDE